MATAQPRVLCVDDEPHVLDGLALHLRRRFEVFTATGGVDGLQMLVTHGPFAAVVSDMRMPGMDGATFLARVRREAPDTTRLLLTGQSDLKAAIAAVNEGQIFRFLSKPCPPKELLQVLEEAAEQHRLLTAERTLLDETLKGAVSVLTEVLGLVAPAAFTEAARVRALTAHAAKKLGYRNVWKFEVAAMLAGIGLITVPPETLIKVQAGQQLTAEEEQLLARCPEVGQRLLGHIPRLEQVAAMVGGQRAPERLTDPEARQGAELLQLTVAVSAMLRSGVGLGNALAALERRQGCAPDLIRTLRDFHVSRTTQTVRAVRAHELELGMVLEEEVRSSAGMAVAPKGRELDALTIERLQNFARGVGLREPIHVRVTIATTG